MKTIFYKRSHFITHLPEAFLYSPSHAWAAPQPDGSWRVGLTQFAVRMLGEMVDHGFEQEAGAPVQEGQIIGWIEGFKAISDLFSIVEGRFEGGNPLLKEQIQVINKKPYGDGWIYQASGKTDARCMDVQAYRQLLDKTIDRILEKQKSE
jgi:glycine cleavage system H protein